MQTYIGHFRHANEALNAYVCLRKERVALKIQLLLTRRPVQGRNRWATAPGQKKNGGPQIANIASLMSNGMRACPAVTTK